MTTIGGRICMGNKGSCCCSVPIVCAWLPGFPSAPRCSRQRRGGSGEGVMGPRGGERAKGGNTVDSPAFYGRNASRTNWLKSRRLLSVHSTLLFPRSKIHRGHAENTLLLFYRASRAVSEMGEGRGGSALK